MALKSAKMGAVDLVEIYIPGSESLIADFSRPFASSDEKGDTTCNKTVSNFHTVLNVYNWKMLIMA